MTDKRLTLITGRRKRTGFTLRVAFQIRDHAEGTGYFEMPQTAIRIDARDLADIERAARLVRHAVMSLSDNAQSEVSS